jgi:hypothetical protein
VLAQFRNSEAGNDMNQRNIGVSIAGRPVEIAGAGPREHNGDYFTVLVTRTTANPRPGSDEIQRACEESWVGTKGYLRSDGSRQSHALAFQGEVVTEQGEPASEVFIVDLPMDLTQPGAGSLCGTETQAPVPPKGVVQRRLTYTIGRKHPGLQGPRHWLRSSPDGSLIAFLMKDEAGVAQLWTVSPNGGTPRQLTHNPWPVASAFSWSPDGRWIAHLMDRSVCLTDALTDHTHRLTTRTNEAAPQPEACVFSPDGRKIAFVRRHLTDGVAYNQIHVLELTQLVRHH